MIRCVECRAEFPAFVGLETSRCPNCESPLRPENPDWDVSVTMNWNALRVMGQWALAWAEQYTTDLSAEALRVSLRRLQEAAPDGAPPLRV